jgi:hypothetical protein
MLDFGWRSYGAWGEGAGQFLYVPSYGYRGRHPRVMNCVKRNLTGDEGVFIFGPHEIP